MPTAKAVKAGVDHDAVEFGAHVKQGGWRLGLLVARNVENRGRGNPNLSAEKIGPKTSAKEFAAKAGTSASRVLRYLKAWNAAAADGWVPPASELIPGEELDGLNVDTLPSWDKFYDASAAVTAKPEPRRGRQQTTTEVDYVKDAIKSDPKLAGAALQALHEQTAPLRNGSRIPITGPAPAWVEVLDTSVDAADREEKLRQLALLAEEGYTAMKKLVDEEGQQVSSTSEVELLQRMTADLTAWQWAATSFIPQGVA